MRALIGSLVALWLALSVFAWVVVLPERREGEPLLIAVGEAVLIAQSNGEGAHENLAELAQTWPADLAPLDAARFRRLDAAAQRDYLDRVRTWWSEQADLGLPALADVPELTWSTDDNPARRVQTHLFRVWHFVQYGEPVDLKTDPSNRDITKTIVQSIAGAGPDIIEAYGPAELLQFVDSGVALDVTDEAKQNGFGLDRMFAAALSSVSVDNRQYAFTANVGYTVLLYHADLFEEAGITPPSQYETGWTLDQAVETSRALMDYARNQGIQRFGIMGMHPWFMVYGNGGSFFNANATACVYNSPQTVAALKAYQDLMYEQHVMPTPAQAAGMAASGGANMRSGVEAATASSLFAAKATAMVTDGRWSYVSLASRNRDRVIRPAIERRLAELAEATATEARVEGELLRSALASMVSDVLAPLSDAEFDAMTGALTPDDRERLVRIGVAHIPTLPGTPWYETAGRVALVNRASPRAELGVHFLRFLASRRYNEQIDGAFDSICGVPEYCHDDNGISGPPRALPGLEAFDSPVFVEAMERYGHPWETSPFIGRSRLGILVNPVFEKLTANQISPAQAAALIERRINDQMHANLVRDKELRAQWEDRTGRRFDPATKLRGQIRPTE